MRHFRRSSHCLFTRGFPISAVNLPSLDQIISGNQPNMAQYRLVYVFNVMDRHISIIPGHSAVVLVPTCRLPFGGGVKTSHQTIAVVLNTILAFVASQSPSIKRGWSFIDWLVKSLSNESVRCPAVEGIVIGPPHIHWWSLTWSLYRTRSVWGAIGLVAIAYPIQPYCKVTPIPDKSGNTFHRPRRQGGPGMGGWGRGFD